MHETLWINLPANWVVIVLYCTLRVILSFFLVNKECKSGYIDIIDNRIIII